MEVFLAVFLSVNFDLKASASLSLSVSPSSVLHYIMVYEMPAGLGAAGSVSNYELDAISLELSEESYSTNTQNGVGRYNSREYTYQTLSKKLV